MPLLSGHASWAPRDGEEQVRKATPRGRRHSAPGRDRGRSPATLKGTGSGLVISMMLTGILWPSAPPTKGPDLLLPLCLWLRSPPRGRGSSGCHRQRVCQAGAETRGNTKAGRSRHHLGTIRGWLLSWGLYKPSIREARRKKKKKTQPSFPFYLFILCFVYSDSGQFPWKEITKNYRVFGWTF